MDTEIEIGRLWDAVRELEDRVRDLENAAESLPSAIGFEFDIEDEFDEDDSEY